MNLTAALLLCSFRVRSVHSHIVTLAIARVPFMLMNIGFSDVCSLQSAIAPARIHRKYLHISFVQYSVFKVRFL